MNHCSSCQSSKPIYTCPACEARSCSLDCVRKHKQASGCSGIMEVGKFASRAELAADANILNRDYNFLQRVGRSVTVGQRDRNQTYGKVRKDRVLNGVNVRSLPPKMRRAAQNKSHFNNKKQQFFWTIEFCIITGEREETKVVKGQVADSLTVAEAARLVYPDSCQVFLQKIDLPANEPGALRLDMSVSLKSALEGRSVLEFPTLMVVEEGVEPKFDVYSLQSDSDSESESDSDSDSSEEEEIKSGHQNELAVESHDHA